MDLESKIEALLFFRGEATAISMLAHVLSEEEERVRHAIRNLKERLDDRGIVVLEKDDDVMLGTHPDAAHMIESVIKDELHKELGRAGLETLSIILYLGPIARSRIDFIRGVSSTFILRNLLMRGLIERVENPDDKRSFMYKPTFDLLSHLGVRSIHELPEFDDVRRELFDREEKASTDLNENL